MTWIRVRDKDGSGATYDIHEMSFRDDAHVRVNAPAQYPDLTGEFDLPRPAKYRTDKAGNPATTKEH